ncbi:tetratricopeptide repeat protein [Pandoraea sp.]|uniref:tetratricopeptide repeat protein n=1 Tax=Pandoraea sp. TaxID=1883445 RepID=UPI00120D8E5B|nr:tetratricopeptide repeat protein [Pandoraea sp.]TAL53347.1 MAG: tetratricopeptide repeat protein [Pandoraea sp.]TAM20436.1 MAG: tetratricopeptide repeat protein [Pandoraea sp.]
MNRYAARARALLLMPLAVALLAACAGPRLDVKPVSAQNGADRTTDLRLADSALAADDVPLSTSLYEKALQADPNSLAAGLGLADAKYAAGDLEQARVLYQRAARQAPKAFAPQLGLARVALRQRDLADAERRYRDLVVHHPDSPLAVEGLGTVLDLEGRHAQAQKVYRVGLQTWPYIKGLRVDLGLSLILDNQPRAGANVLLDIAGLSDAPRQARQNLALAYGLLGNDDAARRILLVDLPASSVDDNVRFYHRVREALASRAANHADGAAPGAHPVPTAASETHPLAAAESVQ